ncbi:hypothetical protein IP69_17185 [Bosea sp. AAP35]|nr:hypothetical protein IP69_17185 [Bosea sp. AAP35]
MRLGTVGKCHSCARPNWSPPRPRRCECGGDQRSPQAPSGGSKRPLPRTAHNHRRLLRRAGRVRSETASAPGKSR